MSSCRSRKNLVPLPASSIKGGERGVLKAPRLDQEEGQFTQLLGLASKTNHEWVSPHFGSLLVLRQATGNTDSLDSPRPGLGASYHLPPYSILYVRPRRLHANGFLSRDSQSGVPKLSRLGFLGLWAIITSHPKFRSGQGLNQTCSPLRELSNTMSHSP